MTAFRQSTHLMILASARRALVFRQFDIEVSPCRALPHFQQMLEEKLSRKQLTEHECCTYDCVGGQLALP